MADAEIRRQKEGEHGLSTRECLKIFGVSKSGYYTWKKRLEEKAEREDERKKELRQVMGRFREIIKKLGSVPGKRTFRTYMFRDYGFNISVKRCARVMGMMNLAANRPKKDAYKGQAAHDHRCSAPDNKVRQDFYIGPRQVVLTDITYFYYGRNRSPIYHCAFRDAYTREILGRATGTRMTTALVKEAYDGMMEKHGKELKKSACCYIHSDQGSQYLSTTFREILSDDGFIQSASRRGNSQDNAPIESFFGRMKARVIDLVALCPDADTAVRLINGYVDDYNTKIYQHSLAGLTPSEYYVYVTQGIYPCDSYFGVEATELMPVGDLVAVRLEEARKKAEKVRERNRERREAAEQFVESPSLVVSRDQERLKREKSKWKKSMDMASAQLERIDAILEKTKNALIFLLSASKKILEELKYPQNWKKYKQLDYVFEMNELF